MADDASITEEREDERGVADQEPVVTLLSVRNDYIARKYNM